MARSGRVQRSRRPARTSSDRRHLLSIVLSIVAAVAALGLLVIGITAWAMPQPAPVQVTSGATATLGRTPWFDAGSTLFAAIDPQTTTQPGDWGCRLQRPGDAVTELTQRADPDVVGTRVVDDASLSPVVTIGATAAGSTLVCSGPRTQTGNAMWVLPTDAGLPTVALSLVVGGIALLGVAGLIHPRGRGLTRFGT